MTSHSTAFFNNTFNTVNTLFVVLADRCWSACFRRCTGSFVIVSAAPLYVSVPFDGRPISFPFGTRQVAIAPDGLTIALASNRGFQIRQTNQKDGHIISTRRGNNPFFSPDGQWVGLFLETPPAMVKVPVRGGTAVTITGVTDRPAGAAWRADGTIVFATTEGLFEVSANGGEPRVIARPDRGRGETLYAWPHFLPGGGSILYTAVSSDTNAGSQIILLNLNSHERKTLVQGSSAVYAASEHLVYAAGSTLNAIAFDAATGAITGKPVAIPGIDVAMSTDNGAANFAVSNTGNLIFLSPTDRDERYVRMDRSPRAAGAAGRGAAAIWLRDRLAGRPGATGLIMTISLSLAHTVLMQTILFGITASAISVPCPSCRWR